MIEQVARAPTHKLDRTFRKDSRVDHRAKHGLGEIGRHRRRFHNCRHAGEQRRRELLHHAPHGKIEGIDVDRHTLERHAHVPADEGARFRQRLRHAVDIERLVRQLAPALRRIHEERADPAVDVDPRIGLRRAGGRGDTIKVVFPGGEELRHRLQHQGALVERQLAQRRPADATRIADHRCEIDALTR